MKFRLLSLVSSSSTLRRTLGFVLLSFGLVSSNIAWAEAADEPGGFEMAADAVIARPLGAAMTTVGVAAFVVSLPFTLLGGNVKESAEELVVKPGKATFVRCLGCRNSGRKKKTQDE